MGLLETISRVKFRKRIPDFGGEARGKSEHGYVATQLFSFTQWALQPKLNIEEAGKPYEWKSKIRSEPVCQICKQGMESTSHALVYCKAAKKIWIHAPFETCFPDAINLDMLDIMQAMAKKLNKSDIEIFVAFCWAIWYSRNNQLFEGKKLDPFLTETRAEAVVEAYKRVKQQGQGPGAKHNVEAAVNFGKQLAGLGVVIRDSNSKVIVAAVKSTQFTGDVNIVEAEAVEWGLVVAKSASLHYLMVESDCQDVVKLVNNKEGSKTETMWVISETQNQSKDFQNVSFHYTLKSCNAYAYSLTKLALRSNKTVVWLEPLPVKI
ncbi:RNase H domain-containing protein [Citrus sinensis]|uniref:RNase H domain-containing protein n=1 Tax=Citrus sinensis TaxID=2711 RepID=A0ACB8LBF3_CITSI|nr:RNase H domain-containing protein [Citrus sinensis]